MSNIFKNRLDFDEITFEHRNKDYGAYQLRKGYKFNVIISEIIGSLIISSFVIFPFLKTINHKNEIAPQRSIRSVEVKMDKMEPPKNFYVPPAPPPPPVVQQVVRYIAPVVVDSLPPIEKTQPSVAQVMAVEPATDHLSVVGNGSNDELITGKSDDTSDEPFMIVEVPPTFQGGGIEKFRDWVQKRTVYPVIAQDNGIQGKVYLSFIVERDGSVTNVKVVKGVDKSIDDEAIRAIQSSPKWSAGLQRGRAVRVRFTINLVFAFSK
jgi:periplasmic protein TonB